MDKLLPLILAGLGLWQIMQAVNNANLATQKALAEFKVALNTPTTPGANPTIKPGKITGVGMTGASLRIIRSVVEAQVNSVWGWRATTNDLTNWFLIAPAHAFSAFDPSDGAYAAGTLQALNAWRGQTELDYPNGPPRSGVNIDTYPAAQAEQ